MHCSVNCWLTLQQILHNLDHSCTCTQRNRVKFRATSTCSVELVQQSIHVHATGINNLLTLANRQSYNQFLPFGLYSKCLSAIQNICLYFSLNCLSKMPFKSPMITFCLFPLNLAMHKQNLICCTFCSVNIEAHTLVRKSNLNLLVLKVILGEELKKELVTRNSGVNMHYLCHSF